MTSTEKRAMDLAAKIVAAIAVVDQPNRNARAMLTDASLWSNISMHIINCIEGKDIEEAAPEEDAPEGDEQAPDETVEEDDSATTRRGRRRRE